MRIIWVSDWGVTSAYASQTALFLPRLRAAGHDVALLATGCAEARTLPDGTPVLPVVSDRYGNNVVAEHARRFGADVVITLQDPHVFPPEVYGNLPWLAWAPLDFETPTPAMVRALQAAKWVWSPSQHGKRAYEKAGIKASYVPHGVDSSVFAPMDQGEARDLLGASIGAEIADETFLVAAVGANRGSPSRKGFFELFLAWEKFTDMYPEALLYVHTEVTGLGGVGEDLRHVMRVAGLDPTKVLFPPQYEYLCGMFGPDHLATAYSAADIYASASHGEGFGLGAIEAQMCGCPVILPDNTAQRETMLSGQNVSVTPYMPFDGATTWGRPIVQSLVGALARICETQVGTLAASRPLARKAAMTYDVDRVFEQHFLPALKSLTI